MLTGWTYGWVVSVRSASANMLIIIGFPIALIIAWAFEATPEGIKRTEAADAAGQRSRGGAWVYIALIVAALSVGLFFLGRYTASRKQTESAELPAKMTSRIAQFGISKKGKI